ncbi:MAG: hypothetical protein ACI9Y1_003672 [Lentisphaeria bacterium]|jgi:hypothetical protein
MKILLYSDLQAEKIPGFAKFRAAIEADNFAQADVRKIDHNLYRARLNRNDRLLFSLYRYQDDCYCLALEYIANHAYEKSRFLQRGVTVDESQIPAIHDPEDIVTERLTYLNPNIERFNLLDKILSFDDEQHAIYQLPPPLVVIGSAGSGKTALTLEKMKHATGDVLYLSLSPFLVQNACNIYYANDYANEDQQVEFLSFREFLESIEVPQGREITLREFDRWFQRHKTGTGLKDAHTLFEEFRGVITGPAREAPWLSREEYLSLGVKQSIFMEHERPKVYGLFEKYRQHLERSNYFDPNILSHAYLSLIEPQYDFIVIDEVQDITAVQLFLLLKALRSHGQFMLCGDSNQIVHPNFFSWAAIKTLFFENHALTEQAEVVRILHVNYRNSPIITNIANRLLKLKHARFGSIDKESHYLVNSIGEQHGTLQLLKDSDANKRDLDNKTARSTHFAVLVMHPHQKAEAKRWFNTPLIFSIQEAKGLEYESIILYNFISGEDKVFRDIAADVDPTALEKDELVYARAKNKSDKSLEIYKFFINALYVAITRAVKNLYIIENNQRHDVIQLLQLARFSGDLSLEKQDSSLEEWQKEARRLELQGKEEQAEAIRQQILQQKPVPWPVLTRDRVLSLQDTVQQTLNKKEALKALEYAVLYHHKLLWQALVKADFRPADQPEAKILRQLHRNHYMNYGLNNPYPVLRDTEKYGVDHRTVFNLTPLMVAARLGNVTLVEQLIERGADPTLIGSNGLNALQMLLEQALYNSSYGNTKKITAIFTLLSPDNLSVQVDGRLIKLDKRLMALFLFNLMFALYYRHLGNAASRREAFTAKHIAQAVSGLPETLLPERRKRQSYISSVLSSNEAGRDCPYNRKLFVRLRRGHYIINPNLKLRLSDNWVPVLDLLHLDDLSYDVLDTRTDVNMTPAETRRYHEYWYQYCETNLVTFKKMVHNQSQNGTPVVVDNHAIEEIA